MKRSIVIDFDGTIIDTKKRHYSLYFELCKNHNLNILSFDEYIVFRKNSYSNINVVESNNILNKNIRSNILNTWINSIETDNYLLHDTIFDGVRLWLERISNKFDLYLISLRQNSRGGFVQLKEMEIASYFKKVYFIPHGIDPVYSKTKVYENSGGIINRSLCWIGDTEVDILSAKKINSISIGVLTGMRNNQNLREAGADFIFKKLTDIKIELISGT